MVDSMQLTYDEIVDILGLKNIPSERTSSVLQPGIYKISDKKKTLEHILPDNVKVSITIDDIRLKIFLKNKL